MAALSLAMRAGTMLQRRKSLRDAAGRFRKATGQEVSDLAAATSLTYSKPGGHAACGKGQYKSRLCKAKSIQKSIANRGTGPTRRQAKHMTWLQQLR